MTFSDLIKNLSLDQVNLWWTSIAPEKAPEIKEKNNWKYSLTKNAKVLPFKWVVEELAKYYKLDYSAKNFNSNLANRDAFCDAFNFEIQEDLVYDNTELSNFKKLYNKISRDYKELFQCFTAYLHNLIFVNQVNPYKIRMALRNSGTETMVIVGMRATQAFSIKNNKAFVTFMIHESMLDVIEPKKISSKEQFTGKDVNKWLITFEVEDWNSIPQNILASNTECFKEEYSAVKDSKRATWNSEANSTNSTFKYLVFKNENVQHFVNQSKRVMMEYFNVEEINNLRDEPNENVQQETFKKLDYLKDELSKVIKAGFSTSVQYSNSKNQYLDIGFNPAQNTNSSAVILLGFFGDDDNEVFFKLKVESVGEFESKEIFTINETYGLNFCIDEFPKSWEELIEKLKKPMEEITKALTTYSISTKFDHILMQQPLNQILYGPPGTGKTFNTINKALSILENKSQKEIDGEDRNVLKQRFGHYLESGQIVFTTFHQSMSYEDFIEGIKPVMNEEEGELSYEVQSGIFKEICHNAEQRNEITIIDNFDETWEKLLEKVKEHISHEKLLKIGSWDYGLSTKDSLKYSSLNSPSQYTFTITKQNVLDTYQKKQARPSGAFQKDMEDIVSYLKSNFELSDYKEASADTFKGETFRNYVLIIDEINRGNISQIFGELITLIEEGKRLGNAEELQVTLPYSKEKFGVPLNLYIIGTMNTADRSVEALDTALRRRFSFVEMMPDVSVIEKKIFQDSYLRAEIMQKINQRIELLVDRNYTLGHSYFIKYDFKASFKNEIIPLLQEYFYNDYGKIGLILGKGFVREKEISKVNHQKIFADFDTRNEIEVIKSYELIPFEEVDFQSAIDLLII